jgi:hypothetical protein
MDVSLEQGPPVFILRTRNCIPPQTPLNDLYTKLLDNKTSFPKFSKHKVLLIGDSRLRGYSENIKYYLNYRYQVSGFIKPGAETKTILKQTTVEVDNLLISDFIIFSCGTDDIGRRKLSEVFSDIIGFIKKVTHTKFILLTVPIINEEITNSIGNYANWKNSFLILVCL